MISKLPQPTIHSGQGETHAVITIPFFLFLELNIVEEDVSGPCAGYRPGDDDLYSSDFIRQFRLDVLETQYPGVTRVRGSNRMQTAYRLDKDADLTLPTR